MDAIAQDVDQYPPRGGLRPFESLTLATGGERGELQHRPCAGGDVVTKVGTDVVAGRELEVELLSFESFWVTHGDDYRPIYGAVDKLQLLAEMFDREKEFSGARLLGVDDALRDGTPVEALAAALNVAVRRDTAAQRAMSGQRYIPNMWRQLAAAALKPRFRVLLVTEPPPTAQAGASDVRAELVIAHLGASAGVDVQAICRFEKVRGERLWSLMEFEDDISRISTPTAGL